ncbi:hypothetical protein ACQKND_16305 [Viridibacillus arvi]|uniref:hypothetical protein n=1 Tax=Viridibacillus arvi TaxID=263475 RepID=UPI003CFD1BEC
MDFDVLMAIDEVRFCSLKCIKRQLANYTDKTIQDYISKANENMKKLSQEEYEECYMFLYK